MEKTLNAQKKSWWLKLHTIHSQEKSYKSSHHKQLFQQNMKPRAGPVWSLTTRWAFVLKTELSCPLLSGLSFAAYDYLSTSPSNLNSFLPGGASGQFLRKGLFLFVLFLPCSSSPTTTFSS